MGDLAGRRVMIVLDSLELGGAERQAIGLGKYLAGAESAEVEVWGQGPPGRAAELCDAHGLRWREAPLQWKTGRAKEWPAALLRFARALRSARPDVLLPFTIRPNLLCGCVWRIVGASTCIWNQRDAGSGRCNRYLERWAARQTPLFASNSQVGAEFLETALGVERSRINVIRNGVEPPKPARHRDAWRAELGIDSRCFVACMVANLHSAKDHLTLLKAWRIVVDELSQTGEAPVLLLAGRLGASVAPAKALAYDLELGRSVRFLGRVDDISGLLSAANIGVFSSRSEGCPNGILECMASGLPVVATDIPGVREALGGNVHKLLSPPGDPKAFAVNIVRLSQDPDRCRALGNANQERIRGEFSPQRMGRAMSDLIQCGLSRHARNHTSSTRPYYEAVAESH